eukprot:TRINITY_DN6678_c0_g1_i1.p1 TRINITY_DN6678_c0_g1~~TRINITY_DN6678_c0_g1_i1.p1  ORF type:complete len:595 (-),score=155.40 TRINITY_DN6678_c0_g1_i1:250-2034(-)
MFQLDQLRMLGVASRSTLSNQNFVRSRTHPRISCITSPPSQVFRIRDNSRRCSSAPNNHQEPANSWPLMPAVDPANGYIQFQKTTYDEVLRASRSPNYPRKTTFRGARDPLMRGVLRANGLSCLDPSDPGFHLEWKGNNVFLSTCKSLTVNQRINHLPYGALLTRKDKLVEGLRRMKHMHGDGFDFIPRTFVLPKEMPEFTAYHQEFLEKLKLARESGEQTDRTTKNLDDPIYIFKPAYLSRGRGVHLITNPDDAQTLVEKDESGIYVASDYVQDPYLIEGKKFDLRLYVVVTNLFPLSIYMYTEGLARFTTDDYDISTEGISNRYTHLTNYSINKTNENFVKNTDAEDDDSGSKWSLTALLSYLKEERKVDTDQLMDNIKDLVVKTILSAEARIYRALGEVPFPETCFELFGFDVLLDSKLKPWLVEVNLSPSLAIETPLDFKIKQNMIVDLFNMVGVPGIDTPQTKQGSGRIRHEFSDDNVLSRFVHEQERRGGYDCLYPTKDSKKYAAYFEAPRRYNELVISWLNGKKKESLPDALEEDKGPIFIKVLDREKAKAKEDAKSEMMTQMYSLMDNHLQTVTSPSKRQRAKMEI